MPKATFSTTLIATIALLNASSASALDTVRKDISLPVNAVPLVTSAHSYPANSTYWPCPPNSRGLAPDPPTPGFMRVGWDHTFDAGTPPFPCQFRLNDVQRIAVTWNLDPIASNGPTTFVDSAFLSFDKRRVSGDHECADYFVTKVAEGPESYGPMTPRTEERWDMKVPSLSGADCMGSRCRVQIKGQMNEWLKNPGTNQGLVLRGDQERLDANDNVSCLTEYANFRLDVSFRFDVKPGSIVTPILKGPIRISPLIALNVTFVRRTTSEAIYDLRWNVIGGGNMDIVRDGSVVTSTPDDGTHRDRAPFGPVRYKVCQSGTTNCSSEVPVSG